LGLPSKEVILFLPFCDCVTNQIEGMKEEGIVKKVLKLLL
jgi:hypothetical protein